MNTLLSRLAAATVGIAMLSSCDYPALYNVSSQDEDPLETVAEDFASALYNWQYEKALQMATPESAKWLQMAASQITEDDINYFNEQEESVDIELNSIDQLSDTSAVAEYQLGNMVVKDLLATSPRLVSDTTTHINLVKRHGKWFADMTR